METSVRAKLWGLDEAPLTPSQFRLLQSLTGDRDVDSLSDGVVTGQRDMDAVAAVRSMAQAGVVDLLSAPLGVDPELLNIRGADVAA
jgi:hypothetical protein